MGQTNLGIVCNDLCLAMVGVGLKGTIGMPLVIMLETHDKRIYMCYNGSGWVDVQSPTVCPMYYMYILHVGVC